MGDSSGRNPSRRIPLSFGDKRICTGKVACHQAADGERHRPQEARYQRRHGGAAGAVLWYLARVLDEPAKRLRTGQSPFHTRPLDQEDPTTQQRSIETVYLLRCLALLPQAASPAV